MRTEEEIDDLIDKCIHREEKGQCLRGMTYEQGVRNALEWVMENSEEDPFE